MGDERASTQRTCRVARIALRTAAIPAFFRQPSNLVLVALGS
jgi:hypothetical protein